MFFAHFDHIHLSKSEMDYNIIVIFIFLSSVAFFAFLCHVSYIAEMDAIEKENKWWHQIHEKARKDPNFNHDPKKDDQRRRDDRPYDMF
jgi:hypothetical protein